MHHRSLVKFWLTLVDMDTDNGTNYKDQNRTQTFTYDALNRLASAQNAGTNCAATVIGGKSEYWGNSYGYDAWGNLL